ncbi:MAG: chemotaxis protein CheW [Candidatus Endonucleobacter sp. (ex Gigantidas childressi)]|nr:chemotaxis protein CheW [Candidatus Endonucleobacter sp. (ex Gigantidas childressi)]
MIPLHSFDVIAQLENKARNAAHRFPKEEDKTYWSGVKFHLNKQVLVVDSREVSEVLLVPDVVPLPNVQPWVHGVANIKGRVIPIFDLSVFFGENENNAFERRRVMLVEKKNIIFGLVVDDVQGVIQFSSISDENNIPANFPPVMRPFIVGCFYKDMHHMVFSTNELVKDQRFICVVEES